MIEKLPLLFPGISLRPALACEISPYGVLAARRDTAGELLTQFLPLQSGSLQPGLKSPNLLDRPAIVMAMKQALTSVAERGRPIPGGRGRELRANRALTVIVPDACVRVLLLDFDALPSKHAEALLILRFRLRKLVPFETEDAAISWQVMSPGAEGIRVLVIVMPHDVLLEFESAIREAGFVPGVVLPSTVAAMPLVGLEAALLVNHNGNSLTTTIVRGQDLLLHRSLDFSGNEEAPPDAPPRLPRSAESREREEQEDIRQSVSVALAYYEDTLRTPAEQLFYIGAASPREFQELLGEPLIAVRDLGSAPELPSRTVPRSLLAPVTGALLNA
jgi:type IV pilus assembly protein PilM